MVDHTDPRAHLRGLAADPDIATAGDDESHTAGSSMDQRPDAHETTVDEGLGMVASLPQHVPSRICDNTSTSTEPWCALCCRTTNTC